MQKNIDTKQYIKQHIKSLVFVFLRKIGVLACRNYVPISIENVESVLMSQSKNVEIDSLIESNVCPIGASLNSEIESQEFTIKTENVFLDIKDCTYSLRRNHLIDKENNVLYEPDVDFYTLSISNQILSKPIRVKGTVAYLSNSAYSNYYHWMCLTLPLIRIYQNFLDLREIDFFYIGEGPFNNFHKETLVKSGISIERVIQRACRADRLVVAIPSRTRFDGYALIDKNTYSFTRGLFHKDDDSNKYLKKGRIYVTRGQVQRRRFINELEVIELLKQYDFETVVMDGKTVQAQADFFCQSEAIIAPHGAALTNLLFINPGVKVIELFPYNYTPKYYQVMASYGGADYFYIKGEKLDSENRGNHPSNQTDILIDIEKLRIFCKDIFNN